MLGSMKDSAYELRRLMGLEEGADLPDDNTKALILLLQNRVKNLREGLDVARTALASVIRSPRKSMDYAKNTLSKTEGVMVQDTKDRTETEKLLRASGIR